MHLCPCNPPHMRKPEAIGVGCASLLERISQTCPGLLSDCAACGLLDAASTHTFLVFAARRDAIGPKGEESGTTPGRAGDGAGDSGETGIGRALPLETIGCDGDSVAVAVILANE